MARVPKPATPPTPAPRPVKPAKSVTSSAKSVKPVKPSPGPRKRSAVGCVAGLIFLAALALGGGWAVQRFMVGGAGIPLRIGQAPLQAGLEHAFPVERKSLFLTVELSEPQVMLSPTDGDRIAFGAKVGVRAGSHKMTKGTVTAAGKLFYDAKTGTFYLDHPEIRQLQIDRVGGGTAGTVRKAVTYVLQKAVGHLPVYQLDTTDPIQRVAKGGIRSVQVRDGMVEVRLGQNP